MKDIYVKITKENADALYELADFITKLEYSREEKNSRNGEEFGKIVTKNFTFRFVPYDQTVIWESD